MTSGKVWFITGAGKGLGRIWARAALERGDRVVATARDLAPLDELAQAYGDALCPIELDVTEREAVFAAIETALKHFGRIDVVVNNAGYGVFGTVEEISEEQARAQVETNLFGALWVTQAALPHLREQRSGHIIQVSSVGGVRAYPALGLYHASKWGLEAFSQSLAAEVEDLGIKVTLVEPTGHAAEWPDPPPVQVQPIAGYDAAREQTAGALLRLRSRPGDPEGTAAAILQVADAEQPPLRVSGEEPLDVIRSEHADRDDAWESWEGLSRRARRHEPVPA